MFRLDVLQDQWLILTLVGGTALVLVVVLSYLAAWRARGTKEEEVAGAPPEPALETEPRSSVPWVLILLYAVMIGYAIVYVLMAASTVPNW